MKFSFRPIRPVRLLYRLGGSNPSILERDECSIEQSKHVTAGLTVLASTSIAVASGTALAATFTSSFPLALSAGALWGALLGVVDRSILLSIRKSKTEKFYITILRVIPRLGLAYVTSIVVSKPLEMALFAPEIDQKVIEIAAENRERLEAELLLENPRIKALKAELLSLERSLAQLQVLYDEQTESAWDEAAGNSGRPPGAGEVYDAKMQVAQDTAEAIDQQQAERSEVRAEIARIEAAAKESIVATHDVTPSTSLLTRLFALEALQEEDPRIAAIAGMIGLIILGLETVPLLVKLFSRPGVYEAIVEHMESTAITFFEKESVISQEQQIQEVEARLRNAQSLIALLYEAIAKEFPRLIQQALASDQYSQIQARIVSRILGAMEQELKGCAAGLAHGAAQIVDMNESLVTMINTMKKERIKDELEQAVITETAERFSNPNDESQGDISDPWQ